MIGMLPPSDSAMPECPTRLASAVSAKGECSKEHPLGTTFPQSPTGPMVKPSVAIWLKHIAAFQYQLYMVAEPPALSHRVQPWR